MNFVYELHDSIHYGFFFFVAGGIQKVAVKEAQCADHSGSEVSQSVACNMGIGTIAATATVAATVCSALIK